MRPVFIGGEIYRQTVFQPPHPLAVPRVMLVADLCRAMGWLGQDEAGQYVPSPQASVAQLTQFHTPDYITALAKAEAAQSLPEDLRQTTRIGMDGNVIHPLVFQRPATCAGAALLAAELTAQAGVVYAPGMGNHHGRPAMASGFCFVNDIALGIQRAMALGVRRIAYLDLDAHHGDGVETAFADNPDVLTISVHEAGRWPRSGTQSNPDHGVWNFPVPPGFGDADLGQLMADKIIPLIRAHQPEALWLLPGADALADDPMAKLSLSNNALWDALRRLRHLAPRLVVGGGGGYNPYALARCWAGLWAILNAFEIPAILPPQAQAVLRKVEYFRAAGRNPPPHWWQQLADGPAFNAGDKPDERGVA